MKKVNKINEEYFIALVRGKQLKVTVHGEVFNTKTKNKIGYVTRAGYAAIGKKCNKKVKHILVHRLVWLCYKGAIDDNYEINHKDGNKQNNRLSNLELVTGSENVKHAHRMGLIDVEKMAAENNVHAKLTNAQVTTIRKMFKTGIYSKTELANTFGVSKVSIWRYINKISYKNI